WPTCGRHYCYYVARSALSPYNGSILKGISDGLSYGQGLKEMDKPVRFSPLLSCSWGCRRALYLEHIFGEIWVLGVYCAMHPPHPAYIDGENQDAINLIFELITTLYQVTSFHFTIGNLAKVVARGFKDPSFLPGYGHSWFPTYYSFLV
ncbi:hypothetical protein ACJX0J_033073, partial [Zea mays]